VSQPPGPAQNNPFDLGVVVHGTPQGLWNPNGLNSLIPREVKMLKGLSGRVHALETSYQEAKQRISKLEKYCRNLQDDNSDIYDIL
jgi:predicted patatin/cPLA2 family phospholipase